MPRSPDFGAKRFPIYCLPWPKRFGWKVFSPNEALPHLKKKRPRRDAQQHNLKKRFVLAGQRPQQRPAHGRRRSRILARNQTAIDHHIFRPVRRRLVQGAVGDQRIGQ